MHQASNQMKIDSFHKETSERSEDQNWVLSELTHSSDFYYVGFEGCNENSSSMVTHIMDRASIEISGNLQSLPSAEEIITIINNLEGNYLQGKINFCKFLGIGYTYILYNYENEIVLRYEYFNNELLFKAKYCSFKDFSNWIQSIKGWNSGKEFREKDDLPQFDKELRTAGCPWPTNIDCVVYHKTHKPVAILEFQNAKKTGVKNHTNNRYFFPNKDYTTRNYKKGVDEQRWRSQEILREQSGLRHLTIVWSQSEDTVVVKELIKVVFPSYLDDGDNSEYLKLLSLFGKEINNNPRNLENKYYHQICKSYFSNGLHWENGIMNNELYRPPLSIRYKTFPFIYGKRLGSFTRESIRENFEKIFQGGDY